MAHLLFVDWATLFIPTRSILEMAVRGTIMYLALFVFLRFLGRRQSGSMGTADLLVIVLLADASQNGLAHDYASVTEGLTVVLTIIFWDFTIDWLCYQFPGMRPILTPPALPLVRNGVKQKRNMRRELITDDELMSHLREQGIEDVTDVKLALLEEDGTVSVIRRRR